MDTDKHRWVGLRRSLSVCIRDIRGQIPNGRRRRENRIEVILFGMNDALIKVVRLGRE